MRLLSLLEEILLEAKLKNLKEADDEESGITGIKIQDNPRLEFDNESDRDKAFEWLKDIENYPETIQTQKKYKSTPGGKGDFGKVIDADFKNPENYVKFLDPTKPEFKNIEDEEVWKNFKFGPKNNALKRSLEKNISNILGKTFTFPNRVGDKTEAGLKYKEEFNKQKSQSEKTGKTTDAPIIFNKKDIENEFYIEFPAEENAALNFSKLRLNSTIKHLSKGLNKIGIENIIK